MEFEKEIQAFDRQTAKLDHAFKKGAFGLAEAIEIVDDFFTLRSFFQSGESGILARIVQIPLEPIISADVDSNVILTEETLSEEDEQGACIPGSDQQIAIQKPTRKK